MNEKIKLYKGQGLIALGAVIWGTQGPFAQFLMHGGASPLFVATMKLLIGALSLLGFMKIAHPTQLRIDVKGLKLTALIGFVSQAGFNFLYYNSVQLIGIANAAVLLYTSPIFFLVLSVWFFNEQLTLRKGIAAAICFLGCAIAVTGGKFDFGSLSAVGLLMALIAALTFAFMSALGKKALSGYAPLTIVAYSFLWGAICLSPVAYFTGAFTIAIDFTIVTGVLGIGLLPAALAYFLYFSGVNEGVPLSQAGIISALEMVSAVLIAWTVFGEAVNVIKVLGVGLILFSVLLSSGGKAEELTKAEKEVV